MNNPTSYFATLQDHIGGLTLLLQATDVEAAKIEAFDHFQSSTGYSKVKITAYEGVHSEKPETDGDWVNTYDATGWAR